MIYSYRKANALSEDFTKAFVTTAPRIDPSQENIVNAPNALTCLFYWVASSMNIEDSFLIPEVGCGAFRPFDEHLCGVVHAGDMEASLALSQLE